MNKTVEGSKPEASRELSFIEHGCQALIECSVSMLSNTILVGFITDGMLAMNTSFMTEGIPSSRDIFTTFVITKSFDRQTKLSLSKGLKLLEGSKSITFSLQGDDSPEATVVINEGDPIAIATLGADWERAMHIRVYEF